MKLKTAAELRREGLISKEVKRVGDIKGAPKTMAAIAAVLCKRKGCGDVSKEDIEKINKMPISVVDTIKKEEILDLKKFTRSEVAVLEEELAQVGVFLTVESRNKHQKSYTTDVKMTDVDKLRLRIKRQEEYIMKLTEVLEKQNKE